MEIDNENDQNEVNAQPVTAAPMTQKERIIRSLVSEYVAAFEAATFAGEWDAITKALNPSAALEIFCIKNVWPKTEGKDEAAIVILKRVKKHLIRLNLTVLGAYEKRMLADAVFHVTYQDEHFTPAICRQEPESSEPGWEDRVGAAQARLNALMAGKEADGLSEAV
jgi:hypothetical protein